MGNACESGVLAAPEDGKVSWTAHDDLAEATAAVLADEGRFDGPTPPLTGSEALDFADLAQIASELLGRPIRRELTSDDDLRKFMATRGAPPAAAEIAIGYYRASRKREFACVDPTLERLIGRPPILMRTLMAQSLTR